MRFVPWRAIVAGVIIPAGLRLIAGAGAFAQSAEEGCTRAMRGDRLLAANRIDSAIAAYREALADYVKDGKWGCAAYCLNCIGQGRIRLGQYDSARFALNGARDLETSHGGVDSLVQSETLARLAYTLASQERELDSAVDFGLRSVKMRESLGGASGQPLAASCYTLAYVYRKKGQFTAALPLLERSYQIQSGVSPASPGFLCSILLALGDVYDHLEDYERSERSHGKAIDILEQSGLGASQTAASCHEFLSICCWHLGELRRAWAEGEKALELCRRTAGEKSPLAVSCYGELGGIAADEGDIDRAEQLCRQSLAILSEINGERTTGVAVLLRDLALIERRRGSLAEAKQLSLRALNHAVGILGRDHPDLAGYHEEIGLTLEALGERNAAIAELQEAIRIVRLADRSSPSLNLARVLTELGRVWHERGRDARALGMALQALDVEKSANRGNSLQHGETLTLLGDIRLAKGDHDGSLDSYRDALFALWPEFSDSLIRTGALTLSPARGDAVVRVLVSRAKALCRLAARAGRPADGAPAALDAYEQAALLAGSIKRTYRLEGSKLTFAGTEASIIDAGVDLALRLYRSTKRPEFARRAFCLEEMSKAGILLEGIQRSRAKQFAGVPDSLVEMERQLATNATCCEVQLERERMKPGREVKNEERLRRLLFATCDSLIRVQEFTERTYPRYAQLLKGAGPDLLEELQRSLDANTALVEYGMSERNLRAFVVSRGSFAAVSTPLDSAFRTNVTEFLRAAKTLDWDRFAGLSSALAQVLLDPIRTHIGQCRRLVIIPDDVLHFIPFEALVLRAPRNARGEIDYTRLEYLIETREVSYASSASLLLSHLRAGMPAPEPMRSLAAFAPVFRDSAGKHVPAKLLAANVRSVEFAGREYSELRSSEEEVRTIAGDFTVHGGRGLAFCNEAATKKNFLATAPGCRFIHIATHSFINNDQPELSGLIFSPGEGSRKVDDEVLYTAEAYNLDLHTDLLVLSGCETGIGKYRRGEGVLALTRGFSYAGANTIVYSLWRVMDESTSKLMVSFYRHFLNGESYESALRHAKLEMIRSRQTSFPFNWAAFLLLRN